MLLSTYIQKPRIFIYFIYACILSIINACDSSSIDNKEPEQNSITYTLTLWQPETLAEQNPFKNSEIIELSILIDGEMQTKTFDSFQDLEFTNLLAEKDGSEVQIHIETTAVDGTKSFAKSPSFTVASNSQESNLHAILAPSNQAHILLRNFPSERSKAAICSDSKGNVASFGGLSKPLSEGGFPKSGSTVLDYKGHTKKGGPGTPNGSRYGAACVYFDDGSVILLGGRNDEHTSFLLAEMSSNTLSGLALSTLGDALKLDSSAPLTEQKYQTYLPAVAYDQEKIYIQYYDRFEIYDRNMNRLKSIQDPVLKRYAADMVLTKSGVFLSGGHSSPTDENTFLSDMYLITNLDGISDINIEQLRSSDEGTAKAAPMALALEGYPIRFENEKIFSYEDPLNPKIITDTLSLGLNANRLIALDNGQYAVLSTAGDKLYVIGGTSSLKEIIISPARPNATLVRDLGNALIVVGGDFQDGSLVIITQ